MKQTAHKIIYWLFSVLPISFMVLDILFTHHWPPSLTGLLIDYALIAFGLVASLKLVTIYKKFTKTIPLLLSGLYSFVIVFILYSRAV